MKERANRARTSTSTSRASDLCPQRKRPRKAGKSPIRDGSVLDRLEDGPVDRGWLETLQAWDSPTPSESQRESFAGPDRSPDSRPVLPAGIQTKLAIGAVDDPLELEADRIADRVVAHTQGAAGTVAPPLPSIGVSSVATAQAKCASCASRDEERIAVQPKCATCSSPGRTHASSMPSGHASCGDTSFSLPRSGGRPLPSQTRATMEPAFGHDLGHVRIHDDPAAAAAARSIGARAFTRGRDVYFAHGEFDPGSRSGQHILAHEIAHTFQQGFGRAPANVVQRRAADGVDELEEAPLETLEATGSVDEIVLVRHSGSRVSIQLRSAGTVLASGTGTWRAEDVPLGEYTATIDETLPSRPLQMLGVGPASGEVLFERPSAESNARFDKLWPKAGHVKVVVQTATTEHLPPGIRELVTPGGGKLDPEELDALNRVARNYANVPPDVLREFAEQAGRVGSARELEFNLERWLGEREKSQRNLQESMEALEGTEGAYAVYRAFSTAGAVTASTAIHQQGVRDGLRDTALEPAEFPAAIERFEDLYTQYAVAMAASGMRSLRRLLEAQLELYRAGALVDDLVASLGTSGARANFTRAAELGEAADEYRSTADASFVENAASEEDAGPNPEELHRQADVADAGMARELDAGEAALGRVGQVHPIATLPNLPLGRLLDAKTTGQARSILYRFIRRNIRASVEVENLIRDAPQEVFAWDLLVDKANESLGIRPGSVHHAIVRDAGADHRDGKLAHDLLLGAGAIVFAIAGAFFSGGLAVPMLVASFSLGAVAAARDVAQFESDNAANQAGLLEDKPSELWAAISVASVALDAAPAVKAMALLTDVADGSLELARLPKALASQGVPDIEAERLIELAERRLAHEAAAVDEAAALTDDAAHASKTAKSKVKLRWRDDPEPHTLFVWHHPALGRLDLGICSDNCGSLLDKLDAWIAAGKSDEAVAILTRARARVEELVRGLDEASPAEEMAAAERVLADLDAELQAKGLQDAFDINRLPGGTTAAGGVPKWVDDLPDKVRRQIDKRSLPLEGETPFNPRLKKNRKGQTEIEKAEIQHGPKKGKRGFVDQEGRIWIHDDAHAGYPSHWDVQIDAGRSHFNVGYDGNPLKREE